MSWGGVARAVCRGAPDIKFILLVLCLNYRSANVDEGLRDSGRYGISQCGIVTAAGEPKSIFGSRIPAVHQSVYLTNGNIHGGFTGKNSG